MSTRQKGIVVLMVMSLGLLLPSFGVAVTDLYVASYGGTFEKALREELAPIFEKKFNCKIHYILGISTETLAKVRIQRANPQIDVTFVDDGPAIQGSSEGLWADLDPKIVTNLSKVYDIALHPNNNGVDMGVTATGLIYNTQIFKEKGFVPPTSWWDVLKPEFVQRFVMPPITNSYGLHALVMFARLSGGGEKNINPGFEVMKKLKKSVISFEPQAGKMSELFQSKEAWIGIWGSGRVYSLADMGFPVDFVYPKEGAIALGVTLNMVKNCKNPRLAQEFINFMLDEKAQEVWGKGFMLGPMNKYVKLSPEVAKRVPYGLDQINKLLKVDWAHINRVRAEWTERWSKEVETR
jgi:putative spermidine/putrescine transport system substrate-binding protein